MLPKCYYSVIVVIESNFFLKNLTPLMFFFHLVCGVIVLQERGGITVVDGFKCYISVHWSYISDTIVFYFMGF